MVTYQIVGHVYTATQALDSTSTTTTWWIPLYNYSGSVYVSQIASGGNMVGSIVWSNITASNATYPGFSTNYITSNVSDTMSLQYNSYGNYWGLKINNVDLTSYNLSVMYVGLGGPSNGVLAFSDTDPSQ
jgi:hypothetical protein